MYHGLGSNGWWDKGLKNCQNVLLPYNYIFEKQISRRVLSELKAKKWILDSGGARYFLNNGYPEYPFTIKHYLDNVDLYEPAFFVSMDYPTERYQSWTWIDRTLEKNAVIFDEWVSRSTQSDFMPVIQGFNKESYLYCAEESADLLRSVRLFGIGSVCRAKIDKITEILGALKKQVDLSKAHLFGQTIRTLPALHKFGIRSTDTANAVVHAGFKVIRTSDGQLFYSKRSPKRKKHNLDHLSYVDFFEINKRNIEDVASGNFGLHKFLGSTKQQTEVK